MLLRRWRHLPSSRCMMLVVAFISRLQSDLHAPRLHFGLYHFHSLPNLLRYPSSIPFRYSMGYLIPSLSFTANPYTSLVPICLQLSYTHLPFSLCTHGCGLVSPVYQLFSLFNVILPISTDILVIYLQYDSYAVFKYLIKLYFWRSYLFIPSGCCCHRCTLGVTASASGDDVIYSIFHHCYHSQFYPYITTR